MDSFIIPHPERNSRLFYVEESTLYNGNRREGFDNVDQGVQLSYGTFLC